MAHKTFTAAKADALGDPISFDIDGDEFLIPRPVPAWPMLELAACGDEGEPTRIAAAFVGFLTAVLPAEQHERFRRTCAEKRVDQELLLEIVQFVIEESTGRPTVPLSSLGERRSSTGTASSGAAGAQAS